MSNHDKSSIPDVYEETGNPVTAQTGNKTYSQKDILMGICMVVVIIGIGLLTYHTIKQKKNLSKRETPSLTTVTAPILTIKEAPTIQLEDVVIQQKWSLFAGMHPTVTLSAIVKESSYPIDYCVFAYHLRNDSEWSSVDAKSKGNGRYAIKLRDLEKDATYEFCLYAVGKKQQFSSEIRAFSIPK